MHTQIFVVDTWSASWDAADVVDVQIAGNDTKKYTSLNYSGIEFTSKTIDATTMDYYHVDIWTPDATTFALSSLILVPMVYLVAAMILNRSLILFLQSWMG